MSFTYAIDPPTWLVLVWYLLAAGFAYGGALCLAVFAVVGVALATTRLLVVRRMRSAPGTRTA